MTALLTPLSAFFSACGHDELVPPDVYEEEVTPYVELRIAIPAVNPSSTRANPMGGEEGNGRERGILHEDDIHDINVFFYIEETKTVNEKVVGLGMDSKDDTEIIKHIYYNLDDKNDTQNSQLWIPKDKPQDYDDTKYDPYYEKGYVILKFQCQEEDLKRIDDNGAINFVAVANVGPIDNMEGKNLGNLRNKTLEYYFGTNSWTATNDAFSMNASNMDYFLMSTAYNEDTLYGGQKTGDNKIRKQSNGEYKGVTTLQRMYARLDLWYNKTANAVTEGEGNNEKVKELKYVVENATGNTVYLTNVLPVNVMQTPSYLFKKVTNFGADWNDWSQSALAAKETEGESTPTLFTWGGKETPSGIPTSSPNDLPTNYVMERHTTGKNSTGTAGDVDAWYGNTAVSKVRTNIVEKTNGTFSGYYDEPKAKYEDDPDYGCNHISIISYANENTHPTNCFHSNYLTGLAFRAVYVPAKIYSAYDEITDGDGKKSKVLREFTQTSENPAVTIYRYSPTAKEQKESESLYFTDRGAAVKYSEDHPGDMAIISKESEGFAGIQHVVGKDAEGNDIKKWGFVCYYNLWLRHYNNEADDPQATYPMEYATVRNNIYRVAVSFRGPGDPTPTMREPDTMKARIFVRKWNYKEEPTINFDLN